MYSENSTQKSKTTSTNTPDKVNLPKAHTITPPTPDVLRRALRTLYDDSPRNAYGGVIGRDC